MSYIVTKKCMRKISIFLFLLDIVENTIRMTDATEKVLKFKIGNGRTWGDSYDL